MKTYLKYLLVIFFTIFSFYYTDKVIELSEYNNTILASIEDYAENNDYKCKEGYIKEDGIVLGLSGLEVNKNKSYNKMKGIGFKEELLEYKSNKCILNKENNLDKYIISGNEYKNNVSLVIDIDTLKYYNDMLLIAKEENIDINTLTNFNNIDSIQDKTNILYKTTSDDIKEFKKKVSNFYCVKTNNFDILKYCEKEKLNSINMINYIDTDLLINIKKMLNNGSIIFIKENNKNLNELRASIKYIKSRGYNIVNIDTLLS